MKRLLRMRTPPYPWISLVAFMLLLVITATIPACSTQSGRTAVSANTSPDDVPKGDGQCTTTFSFSLRQRLRERTSRGDSGSTRSATRHALSRKAPPLAYIRARSGDKPFEYLILSWNADTPKGTHRSRGRVHAGSEGDRKWAPRWGTWSSHSFTGPDGRETLPRLGPVFQGIR